MNILAFDTSHAACSAAILSNNQITSAFEMAPMQHAQLILSMIENLLKKKSLAFTDLQAIAYTKGPGSFTGIRIGSSVAQGLAYAWHLPVIQISALAALAQTAYLNQQLTHFLIALDARMGQIYWAEYRIDASNHAVLIGSEILTQPTDVPNITHLSDKNDYIGLGDGWNHYQAELEKRLKTTVKTLPNTSIDAKAFLMLAKSTYEKKEWHVAKEALPNYLR